MKLWQIFVKMLFSQGFAKNICFPQDFRKKNIFETPCSFCVVSSGLEDIQSFLSRVFLYYSILYKN
jgi:hypothetical protein